MSQDLSGANANIMGTLTFDRSYVGTINNGTLNAYGNIDIIGTGHYSGTANVNMLGSNAATLSSASAGRFPGATFTINKPGATVTMANAAFMNNTNQGLVITAGTLNMAGFNLTVGRNITNAGTLRRGASPSSCGTISQGGTYSGNAAICP